MRCVLDTNVVASGLLWDGSPRRLLKFGAGPGAHFFTSVPMLVELTEILSGAKFAKKIAASRLPVDQLVDLHAQLAGVVQPASTPRLATDPDDDVVIGTALAARADFLVTGDRALLMLKAYEGGRINSVTEALRAMA